MDIEGSEILQQKWDWWKHTRLLMVEIRVVHLRQEYGPSSWDLCGYPGKSRRSRLCTWQKRFWTLEYWTPGTTQRNLDNLSSAGAAAAMSLKLWWRTHPHDLRVRPLQHERGASCMPSAT
eukprot:symbB.v1.2.019832.t2/scaffold1644.1/size164340/2